jgi:hypothetical protein
MKIIFTLIAFSVFGFNSEPVISTSFINNAPGCRPGKADEKKEISIQSDRRSGEMQLRFKPATPGEAMISILNY